MRRRHLVVLVSACTLLGLVFVFAASIGIGVNTRAGREQIRVLVQQQLGGRVRGHVYVGNVSGGLLTGLTIDSLEIRGLDDSLFLSTGQVTLQYNPRDLMDRRLLLRQVEVEHPVVRIQQYPQGDWSHQRIFRRGPSTRPSVPGRGFGDFVILDSVTVKNASFILVRRWAPNDTLRGAAREKTIAAALADTMREIRRAGNGAFTHVYRWTQVSGFLPHVRLAHPDSGRFGREFSFERGKLEEQEPPFSFRNVHGRVRHLGDSMFIDMPHFDLPASTGSMRGKVWWGNSLPTRWDLRIKGDSVSLKDVAWVYATLPRTGSGRTDLHIHNSADNLNVMEYALTNLDARSTRSRLIGNMTFAVGNPVLHVKDVDLRGAPINFDLVRTLAGGPLPVDWQGDIVGWARGPGGPLTRFVLDSSAATFRDAHVPGAVSRFTGRGELDILFPAFTVFHGFDVSSSLLDLRTLEYLFPDFARIGGTMDGSARLDSSWMDVRFSNADVNHRNGPGDPSRFTGSGRVTYGETFMTYDVSLVAQPLSLVHFSRAYELGLKGLFTGPITAKGTTENLRLTADLTGPGGRMTYDGTVDADPLTVAAHGQGRVETLELSQLIDREKAPVGWITGDYQLDVVGDTNDLGTLRGNAAFQLERSRFGGVQLFASRIAARFDDRRMFVDTLRLESTAAVVDGSGAIGLAADRVDSIAYTVTVDSLGGLREYLTPLLPSKDSLAAPDSLSGALSVQGVLSGSVRSFRLAGHMTGSNMVLRKDAGREVNATFDIADPFVAPTGTLAYRSRALQFGGAALDSLGIALRLNEGKTGAFSIGARSGNNVTLELQGEFARVDTSMLVTLRSLQLAADKSRWLLAGPSDIRTAGRAVSIDSLVLLDNRGGRISLGGAMPDTGRARFLLRADSVALGDISMVAQLRSPLSGWANVAAAGAGTSLAPVINVDARLSNVAYGNLTLESVRLRANYAAQRAQVQMDLTRGETTVLQAQGSLPIELRYFGARLLDDSIQASVKTNDATLDIAQVLVPGLRDATGKLVATMEIGGTWRHPDVTGALSVENGEATIEQLGIRLKGIHVDLGLFGHADSLAIRRMVGWSGATAADSISVSGYVAYRDFADPLLNLRIDAKSFHAIDKRTLARLNVSTEAGGITLDGRRSATSVSGGVFVESGQVYLPDPQLARKQGVDVRTQFADTASFGRTVMVEQANIFQTLALNGVRVRLGEEVSLRSPEADIRLSGSLVVRSIPVRIPSITIGGADTVRYQAVLDGTLFADRGTYTLKLLEFAQREFQVENGGTILFYPFVDLSPTLNISAMHVVKRANQSDLHIRVRLTGPLYPNPIVTLESGETFPMSSTDMVSYLIFGLPSAALGDEETRTAQLALQTLNPTTYVAGVLGSQVGRLIGLESFQIRPGAFDAGSFGKNGQSGDALRYLLYTTRLSGEVQVSENVFVSLSAGLCTLDRSGASNGTELDALGLSGKLEYRFSESTALKAGREPPASSLTCGRSVTGRAFIPTPSQWGLSLFKSWRF